MTDSIRGFFWLGLSGLASTLALLVLASGSIAGLSPPRVAEILLAIQWHIFGMAIVKAGADYAIFTIVSRDPRLSFALASVWRSPTPPLVALFGLACVPLFGAPGAMLVALALGADALSTFRQAELNARRDFGITGLSGWLNYPLYVLILFAVARSREPSLTECLGWFAATSVLRLAFLEVLYRRSARADALPIRLHAPLRFALQSVLNVAVFRLDQIALALMLFLFHAAPPQEELGTYVYLARFPELATGLLVIVGTVLFPLHHLNPIITGRPFQPSLKLFVPLGLAAAAGTAAVVAAAAFLKADGGFPLGLAALFLLQVPLILLANLATYSMQSQGHLPGLLRNLGIACAVGSVVAILAIGTSSIMLMAAVVPIQLAAFIGLSLRARWGPAIPLHDSVPAR
jgi:hypothetical protein